MAQQQQTLEELQADMTELRKMMAAATRPNVKKELQRVMAEVEKLLEDAQTKSASSSSKPAAAAPAAKAGYPAASASSTAPAPARPSTAVEVKAAGPWKEIGTYSQDLGGFNGPFVTVDIRMKGIEALPAEAVTCDFTESSFDLKVMGFEGANHRMIKTNLDKDIDVSQSSVKVKKNHVIVSLAKVKGEYGYDNWTDLVAKGKRRVGVSKADKENPTDSIMGMMKDLYDDGDDNMKKIIGEAMFKARTGQKDDLTSGLGKGLDDI